MPYIKSYLREIDLGDAIVIDGAEWDKNLHYPVPTDKFIRKYTDTVIEGEFEDFGTGSKSYARRFFYANMVKSILEYKMNNRHDKMMNEYYTAHDEDRQFGFCLMTAYIALADNQNLLGDVFVDSGIQLGISQDDILKSLEIPAVKLAMKNYDLYIRNINETISEENYRRDY